MKKIINIILLNVVLYLVFQCTMYFSRSDDSNKAGNNVENDILDPFAAQQEQLKEYDKILPPKEEGAEAE